MEAYTQIIKQLISEIKNHKWQEVAQTDHFEDEAQLYDVCLFNNNSQKKFGIAWIKFSSKKECLVLPFCLVRYDKQQTDLIHKFPWSLREASCDPLFYSSWNYSQNHQYSQEIRSALGNLITSQKALGTPYFAPEQIQNDENKADILLKSEETLKFLKWISLSEHTSKNIEILEFLTQNPSSHFEHFPKLIETFYYSALFKKPVPFAYSIQSLSHLSRISDVLKSKMIHSSGLCKKFVEKIGRILAEFHKTMLNARSHTVFAPVSVSREDFLKQFLPLERIQEIGNGHPKLIEIMSVLVKDVECPHVLISTHGSLSLNNILSNQDDVYLTGFAERHEGTQDKEPFFKDVCSFLTDFRFWFFSQDFTDKETLETLQTFEGHFKSGYRKNLLEEPLHAQLLPSSIQDFDVLIEVSLCLESLKLLSKKNSQKTVERMVAYSDQQLTRLHG